jgi:very-short-patch-repair endonuclease
MPSRPRKVYRGTQPPSRLETRFETLWRTLGGPGLEREYRFHPVRRWRADFAHLPSRTLIEIEGGIYVQGRHNRPAGFAADLEKYLEAGLAGWRVIRLGPNELTSDHIARLIRLVQAGEGSG